MARDTDLWQIFWNNFEFSSFHILHQKPCYPGRLVADTFLSKSPQYNECESNIYTFNSSTGCGDSALDTQFYLSLGQRAGQTGCCYFHHKVSPDLRPEVELLCSHSPSCCSRLADWDWLVGSLVDPGRDNSLYNILQHCRTAQGNWAQSQPIQAANSSITRSRVHCYC